MLLDRRVRFPGGRNVPESIDSGHHAAPRVPSDAATSQHLLADRLPIASIDDDANRLDGE
jgi:hypothetical protein